MRTCARINELYSDADLIGNTPEAAFNDILSAELTTKLLDV
jgi:hypothetical protein